MSFFSRVLAFVLLPAVGIFLTGCAIPPFNGDSKSSASVSSIAPMEEGVVYVYFGNTQWNPNAQDCGIVYPVSRQIAREGDLPLQALSELFRGPSEEERIAGYASFFSSATADAVKSVRVQGGTAYVDLQDLRQIIPNASTSCGSAAFLAEMGATLTQFPGITRVLYAMEGDPKPFYEWLQFGCSAENDHCDKAPFEQSASGAF